MTAERGIRIGKDRPDLLVIDDIPLGDEELHERP